MKCPRCQQENPLQAKFCLECGTPLALKCTACGTELPAAAKFCPGCAHPVVGPTPVRPRFNSPEVYTPKHLAEKILTSKSVLEGERKQVTVLFADMKGSMELLADRDPEDARKLLDPIIEHMMEAVHRYEGTVNQVMGDGIMALFGAPLAHEDHAVRACYAALRMQESVKKYAEQVQKTEGIPVQVRVGLNSGEVVARSIGSDLKMDYTAVGQTTHLAARMEQMAMPGSILMTNDTLQLVEGYVQVKSLGPVNVKGMNDPVKVHEVTGAGLARSRLQAAVTRGLTRFVGRTTEFDMLCQALDRAKAGHGQVVALVGEPGVGKSRLFWEFTHSRHTVDWLIVESGSVSYGKATAYLPVIDLLKGYFDIQDRDDARKIREKVTGKLLTLDKALESTLPAFLALLDVPFSDVGWETSDPPPASSAYPGSDQAFASAGEPGSAGPPRFRRSALDRFRDPGGAGELSGKSADEQAAPPGKLSSRIPASLGNQEILQPTEDRSAAAGRRRRTAPGPPGARHKPAATQATVNRANRGESILPGGNCSDTRRDKSSDR